MANGIPGFQCHGLSVGASWVPVDIRSLPEAAKEAFFKHVGRFVRIHPDDVAELADLGLALGEDGTLRIVDRSDAPPAPRGVEVTTTPPEPAPPPAPSGRGSRSSR